jgi:hypothetical protein
MEGKEGATKEVGGKSGEHCNTEAKGRVCFKRMEHATESKSAERSRNPGGC